MSKLIHPVDSGWACPRCKQTLEKRELSLFCEACMQGYRLTEGGIPCLLPNEAGKESDEYWEQKEAVKEMFTSFNRALEENGVSRFSSFMNWGYAEAAEDGCSAKGVNEQSLRLLREIMDGVKVQGSDVLEIACGRGGNVRALCKSYQPRSVAGIDLTEANIAFCHASNRYEYAYFCIGDAEELPVADECFDIVLNIEASDLYPRIRLFYDEAFRILKPGGMFVYADDLDARKFEEGERYLEALGFETVRSRDISEQALLASDLARGNRIAALDGAIAKDDAIWGTMGVPGTSLYDDMRAGKRKYKILHMKKKA
ncbi:methyltransferase domain-containing protein [Paenibacillus sp. LPE1-1-1.1]|uniref:methyltransferase domain-containing protein n=1 Tax=Paenibacillus sp. LPE1-1-1.1 TaxID=3135230 RepID=UPI0034408A5B